MTPADDLARAVEKSLLAAGRCHGPHVETFCIPLEKLRPTIASALAAHQPQGAGYSEEQARAAFAQAEKLRWALEQLLAAHEEEAAAQVALDRIRKVDDWALWEQRSKRLVTAMESASQTEAHAHSILATLPATPSQDEDRLRCTHYLCPPADVPNCDVRGCLLKKQMINDEVTDDMLNAGQERMCEVSSNTYFDDYTQAEIFKAMLAAKGAFRAGVESATPSQDDHQWSHDVLHDLVMLRAEEWALSGGGPGIKERWEKAWRAAEEVFEP